MRRGAGLSLPGGTSVPWWGRRVRLPTGERQFGRNGELQQLPLAEPSVFSGLAALQVALPG